jgi:hypothetical protein
MMHQGNLLTGEFQTGPLKESTALQRVKMLKVMLRPDVLMRHITPGGYDARTGAKLKAMGRLAGCADLEFMWRDGNVLRVLFLELKLPGRKQLPSQLTFMDKVTPFGPYCIATTIDEALAALTVYGLLIASPSSGARVPAIDQDLAHAGLTHFAEVDFGAGQGMCAHQVFGQSAMKAKTPLGMAPSRRQGEHLNNVRSWRIICRRFPAVRVSGGT